MRLAAFIERDGLLNRVRIEHDFPVTPMRLKDFRVCSEAAPLVDRLHEAGFLVIATTNQPAISDGDLSRRELDLMHEKLTRELGLDDVLICPHSEADRCPCRKPKPGLFIEAGFKWRLDLERSVVISDKWQDAEAARIAGCTSILVESPWNGPGHHDFLCASFEAAVDRALALTASHGALAR